MAKHSKQIKSISSYKWQQSLPAVLVIAAVALVGFHLLFSSHAATPFLSVPASAGTLNGGATASTDTTAISGNKVVFGTAASSTPPPTSSEGGCTSGGVVAPCIGSNTTGASGWGTPTMDDEFTEDTSLNTKLWSPDWFGSGTVQNGTYMYSSNVSISGGYLNLEASGSEGSSGGLITTDPDDGQSGHTGYQFTYGYVESRIYIPASGSQVANWPAFWTVGQTWPEDGELDVMEGLGGSACYHFHYGSGNGSQQGGCASGNYTGWHTFGAEWEAGIVTYYYDGVKVGQVSSDITTEPMFIILENSTGSYGLLPVTTPSDMLASYVRVWQN
jgi:hypothetical protein